MSSTKLSTILLLKVKDLSLDFFMTLIFVPACALGPDLALLPNGDMTEVGEKGMFVLLSVGPPLITNFIGITVCHLFLCAMNMWLILTVKWRSTC